MTLTRRQAAITFGITGSATDPTTGTFVNGDHVILIPSGGSISVSEIIPHTEIDNSRSPAWVKHGAQIYNGLSLQGLDSTSGAKTGADGSSWRAEHSVNPSFTGVPLVISTPCTLMVSKSTSTPGKESKRPQVLWKEVFTFVSAMPAANAFRPPFIGSDKSSAFTTDMIDWGALANRPPIDGAPSFASVAASFDAPWVEHSSNPVSSRFLNAMPMPDYGADIAKLVSTALLKLNESATNEEKRPLLIGFLQYAIDLYAAYQAGARWQANGGHASGRLPVMLAASRIFNHAGMLDACAIGNRLKWGEHGQAWKVNGTTDLTRHHAAHIPGKFPTKNPDWTTVPHMSATDKSNRPRAPYNVPRDPNDRWMPGGTWSAGGIWTEGATPWTDTFVGLPEWGPIHYTTSGQDGSNKNLNYRWVVMSQTWGYTLAIRMMGLKAAWGDDNWFDVVDRHWIWGAGTGSDNSISYHRKAWQAYRHNADVLLAAAPRVTPPGGIFTGSQVVSFATYTTGAEIRITRDGTEPHAGSELVSGDITLNESATIKARAFKDGLTESDTVTAVFQGISPLAPGPVPSIVLTDA